MSSKLKFDLDSDEKNVSTDAIEAPVLDTKKIPGLDDIMLPISTVDSEGNSTVTMKLLDVVSADEWRVWLRSVLPFAGEELEVFGGFKPKRKENGFYNLKVRRRIFEEVVKLHEIRWLFAMGRQLINKETQWN